MLTVVLLNTTTFGKKPFALRCEAYCPLHGSDFIDQIKALLFFPLRLRFDAQFVAQFVDIMKFIE